MRFATPELQFHGRRSSMKNSATEGTGSSMHQIAAAEENPRPIARRPNLILERVSQSNWRTLNGDSFVCHE